VASDAFLKLLPQDNSATMLPNLAPWLADIYNTIIVVNIGSSAQIGSSAHIPKFTDRPD